MYIDPSYDYMFNDDRIKDYNYYYVHVKMYGRNKVRS